MLISLPIHLTSLTSLLSVLNHTIGPLGQTLPIQTSNTLTITKRGKHIISHLLKEDKVLNNLLKRVYEIPFGVSFVVYVVGEIMKRCNGKSREILGEVMQVYSELDEFEQEMGKYTLREDTVETAAKIAENCLFGKFSESERRKIIDYGLYIIQDRVSYEAIYNIDIESSIISYEGEDRKMKGIVFRCKSRVGYSRKKQSENILYIPDRHSIHILHTLDTQHSISYYTHLASSFSNYLQNLNISTVIFESEAPVYHKDVLSLLNIDYYEVILIQHARCTNISSITSHFESTDLGFYLQSSNTETILQRFETLLIISLPSSPLLLLNNNPLFSTYKETISQILAVWKLWAGSDYKVISSGCYFQVLLSKYFIRYPIFSEAVWSYVRVFYTNISKLLPQTQRNFLYFKLLCEKEPHYVEISEDEESFSVSLNSGNSDKCIESSSLR